MTTPQTINFDFDQFPFTALLPEDVKTIAGVKPPQLDLTDDEALDLAIRVDDDPFFGQYLFDGVRKKLTSDNPDTQRNALYSARGLQRQAQQQWERQQEDKQAKEDKAETQGQPSPEPAPAPQPAPVAPPIDQDHSKVVLEARNRALDCTKYGDMPDEIKVLLAGANVSKMEIGTFAWKFWATGRDELQKAERRHAEELEGLRQEHQFEISEIDSANDRDMCELIDQLNELTAQNEALRAAKQGWATRLLLGARKFKGKVTRVVAAAREPYEPNQEFPGHGGTPTPTLKVVEDPPQAS